MPNPIDILIRSQAQLAGINQAVRGIEALSGRVQQFLAYGPQIAAALGVTAFAGFIKQAINTADEMGKMAQKTGIAVESFSTLAHAAELSDVSVQELGIGLRQLAQQTIDASRGAKESANAFERVGVSVRNASGGLKTTEDLLLELADRFQELPDGIQKTDLAVQLFGRSGQNLIPLLNQGAAGIRAAMEEGRAFGLEISTRTAAAAEEFNDNLTRLKAGAEGLALTLATQLLDPLVKLTDHFVELVKTGRDFQTVFEFIGTQAKSAAGSIIILNAGLRVLSNFRGGSMAALLNFGVETQKIVTETQKALDALGGAKGEDGPKPGFVGRVQARERAIQDEKTRIALAGAAARAQAEGAVQMAQLDLEEQRLKANYDQRLITLDDYLQRQQTIARSRAAEETALARTGLNSADVKTREEAAAQIKIIEIKLQGELLAIEQQGSAERKRILQEQTQALQEQTQALDDVNREFEKASLDRIQFLEREGEATKILLRQRVKDEEDLGIALAQVDRTTNLKIAEERARIKEEADRKEAELQEDLRRRPQNFTQGADNFLESLGDRSTRITAVFDTLGIAIRGVGDGITGLITGTQTWGEAMQNTRNAVIGALVQIGVQQVAQFALSKVIQAASTALGITQATTLAAAYAPASAAANTATFGASSAVGLGITLAAIAAIIGALSAFRDGGLIGGAPSAKDNVIIAARTGEFVHTPEATQYYGTSLMHAINEMRIPRETLLEAIGNYRVTLPASPQFAFASGGQVGSAGFAAAAPTVNVSPAPVQVAFVKNLQELKDLVESSWFETRVVSIVNRKKTEIGVPS